MLVSYIQNLNFPDEVKEKLKDSVAPKLIAIKKTQELYEDIDGDIIEDLSTINSLEETLSTIEDGIGEKKEKREALEKELEMLNKDLEKHLSHNIEKLSFWLFLGIDSAIVSSILYGPDTRTLELFS